ncbi:hypothetical protein A2U01_0066356, partial [Trifolium medium]|nr:hypothetical protein [Trifolium medium]
EMGEGIGPVSPCNVMGLEAIVNSIVNLV